MLKITDLVKQYGRFTAVDHLNLTIEEGSIFGFVGPNGAGKTTTMKIMAGLLAPTGGSVVIKELDVTKNKNLLREKIGYMPDFFGVYDNLKVTEYMDFYAGAYYIPYKDRKEIIDNLLDIVDLSHKKNDYVDSLSRGMKQRLCLARSLVHDPDILLLDEPASGLDPRARVEMKEILKQLKELGKTIIISSHILPELAEMCTEIGIIDKGSMVVCGSVNDIMRQLKSNREINIKTIGDFDTPNIAQVLSEFVSVSDIRENVYDVTFSFTGDDKELAAVVTAVVKKEIPVVSVKEKEGNLEEIFMQVTGGNQND